MAYNCAHVLTPRLCGGLFCENIRIDEFLFTSIIVYNETKSKAVQKKPDTVQISRISGLAVPSGCYERPRAGEKIAELVCKLGKDKEKVIC